MSTDPPCSIRATQDIQRFRTVVARRGTRGNIIGVTLESTEITYTVVFAPTGLSGATVTVERVHRDQLAGLTGLGS